MKRFWLIVVFVFVVLPVGVYYYVFIAVHVDVVNGITAEKIKEVRPGMTVAQVIKILGRPYGIAASLPGTHNVSCKGLKPGDVSAWATDIESRMLAVIRDTGYCCEANREEMPGWDRSFDFVYTRRPYFTNVILKAEIDSSLHLRSLYAYMHDGTGTERIYNIAAADSEYFCDKKVLKRYFD